MDYWIPKHVELLNVMNKINHQILCILLDYIYTAKWYGPYNIKSKNISNISFRCNHAYCCVQCKHKHFLYAKSIFEKKKSYIIILNIRLNWTDTNQNEIHPTNIRVTIKLSDVKHRTNTRSYTRASLINFHFVHFLLGKKNIFTFEKQTVLCAQPTHILTTVILQLNSSPLLYQMSWQNC